MSKRKDGDDKKEYAIGYKKPPVKNQFQKGQSGNLKGRPKGAKNALKEDSLASIVQSEACRDVTVMHGEQTLTLTIAAATFCALSQKALKGDMRAKRLFFEMVEKSDHGLKQAEREKPQHLTITWLPSQPIPISEGSNSNTEN